MSDDLVRRLRDRAFHASGYMGDSALTRLCREAADAIEARDAEMAALRSVVVKLVIEPADTVGHAYYCAGWLEASDVEDAAVRRALADTGTERAPEEQP